MAAHSSILAWKIPWTAEPGSYSNCWGFWFWLHVLDRHVANTWPWRQIFLTAWQACGQHLALTPDISHSGNTVPMEWEARWFFLGCVWAPGFQAPLKPWLVQQSAVLKQFGWDEAEPSGTLARLCRYIWFTFKI